MGLLSRLVDHSMGTDIMWTGQGEAQRNRGSDEDRGGVIDGGRRGDVNRTGERDKRYKGRLTGPGRMTG